MLRHQRLWNRQKNKISQEQSYSQNVLISNIRPNVCFCVMFVCVMIHYPPWTAGCQISNKLARKQSMLQPWNTKIQTKRSTCIRLHLVHVLTQKPPSKISWRWISNVNISWSTYNRWTELVSKYNVVLGCYGGLRGEVLEMENAITTAQHNHIYWK